MRTHRPAAILFLMIPVLLAFAACNANRSGPLGGAHGAGATGAHGAPAGWPTDPRALPAYATDSGSLLSWDALIQRCSTADAVLIGEQHGHPQGLAVAAALFEDVVARNPGRGSIAFEFFERDKQSDIDDYTTGITDEAAFRELTGRTDANYAGHREMLEAAKAAGIPIAAANAPARYRRIASKEGFDRLRTLTPLQRTYFAVPDDVTPGAYRDRFFEIMSGMGDHSAEAAPAPDAAPAPEDPMIINAYRAQNFWDATMADTIINLVRAGHTPAFLVVGQFHVDHDGGLTQRVRAGLPERKVIVVSVADAFSHDLRAEDRDRADIILYIGERPGE